MKCNLCHKSAVIHIKPLMPLCKSCFCRIVEKRIRKDARINGWFKKDDRIYADSSFSRMILDSVVHDLPKRFVKGRKAANKVVLAKTSDGIIADSLERIFANKSIARADKREIPLLKSLTDEEASAYARFKKIKFVPRKKSKAVMDFVNKIQAKYPETKSSLVRAITELELC